MPKPIVIVGSINMDLVCKTPRIPAAGETILGSDLQQIPGGKGANQAVAAARLSGNHSSVHMIGRVGDDAFGIAMRDSLQQNGVDVSHVTFTAGASSGCALILVDDSGQNAITVAPGANARLSPDDIDAARDLIASAACVVMQLEVPLETIGHTIELCRQLNVFTLLDPAPVPPDGLPSQLFAVDLFSPNQSEAALLLGAVLDPKSGAERFRAMGARTVVLKLGADGSMRCGETGNISAAPFRVTAVDTTAAGDAFTAGLAVANAEGVTDEMTLQFANASGAICCQTFGAQPSLPTRSAVEQLLSSSSGTSQMSGD